MNKGMSREGRTDTTVNRGLRGFGTLLIVIGVLLAAGGIGLVVYNMWDSDRAGRAADVIQEQIDSQLEEKPVENAPVPAYGDSSAETEAGADADDSWLSGQEMPVTLIEGNQYIGTLEIPSIGLRLPVMDSWSYERLRTSACLYSGSYYTDDMVICAHNYQNHFGPIMRTSIGADVYFITMDKVIYHYTISNRETLKPTAVGQMIFNRNNAAPGMEAMEDWDLTLFTCTPGGRTRCAVRCIRAA